MVLLHSKDPEDPENLRLGSGFLNEFSPRAERFRLSQLTAMFPEGTVWDPQRMEADGTAFRIDAQIDRRDLRAKQRSLREKYGVNTIEFRPSEFVGFASIPSEIVKDLKNSDSRLLTCRCSSPSTRPIVAARQPNSP